MWPNQGSAGGRDVGHISVNCDAVIKAEQLFNYFLIYFLPSLLTYLLAYFLTYLLTYLFTYSMVKISF